MFELKDRNIILTGSNGLLGKVLEKTLKASGAHVMGLDVSNSYYDTNIANEDQVNELYRYLSRTMGRESIHGLINNAAVSFKGRNTTQNQFKKTLGVNVSGTHNMIQGLTHWNLAAKGCSIVNVGSIYGLLSPDFRIYEGNEEQYNSIAYGASKAAVIQMTRYFSVLLSSKGIRVNTVSPSGIEGGQDPSFMEKYVRRVPEGRMVKPEEVAQVIAFLLSPLSSGINGANLPITAGMDIW